MLQRTVESLEWELVRMRPVSFHDLSESSAVPPALFARAVADLSSFCDRAQPIIDAVRLEGDAALQRFARMYDGVTAPSMCIRAEESEFADALAQVPADVTRAIQHAIDNIRRFHEAQKPGEMWLKRCSPASGPATVMCPSTRWPAMSREARDRFRACSI